MNKTIRNATDTVVRLQNAFAAKQGDASDFALLIQLRTAGASIVKGLKPEQRLRRRGGVELVYGFNRYEANENAHQWLLDIARSYGLSTTVADNRNRKGSVCRVGLGSSKRPVYADVAVSIVFPAGRKPAEKREELADVNVTGIGDSVLQFEGLTDAGRDWLRDNCDSEPWQWLGNRLGVDHRYAGNLIEHAAEDGLRVRVN